ncbi:MAG: TorF family putative porin [Steroidobacteraceae bacterium]
MRALGFAALAASCLFSTWPAACPAAVNVGGSLALTQDDVYRGVSETCGHPAVQADLHIRDRGTAYLAAFAGVWGSAGLSGYPCGRARELDIYAGYSLALTRTQARGDASPRGSLARS